MYGRQEMQVPRAWALAFVNFLELKNGHKIQHTVIQLNSVGNVL